jgi:hypothetical protein
MVSRTPTIRPSQLSALKVLNPHDEEDEQREDEDSQAHVEEVIHRHSQADARIRIWRVLLRLARYAIGPNAHENAGEPG